MANLSFRSSSTAANSVTGGDLAITAPAGLVDNDLLLAHFIAGNAGGTAPTTLTPPAGWTLVGSQGTITVLGGGFSIRYGTYYKIASSEPGSYTWTTNSTLVTLGTMVDYDNPNTSTPFDTSATAQFIATATPTASAITTAEANELDMTIFWGAGTGTGVSWTPPPGMTERVDFNSIEINDVLQAVAGSTGTQTATGTATGDGYWLNLAFRSEASAPNAVHNLLLMGLGT